MAKEKAQENFIDHTSLIKDDPLDINSQMLGFSVNCDVPFTEWLVKLNYFRSDFFVLTMMTGGEATISINLKKYAIKANDLILSSPYDIKRLISFNDCSHCTMQFTSNFLEKTSFAKDAAELLNYFSSQSSPVWTLNDKDASLITKLMKEVSGHHGNCSTHPYGSELLCHSMSIFLYEMAGLGKAYSHTMKSRFSRKESIVINFTRFLKKDIRLHKNLQQYAAELNISPKYLAETVKEITGKSAGGIINSFVVQEASMLLDNPELSIGQISDELNFSDQSFFGKFFKRNTGLSPKEYRNSV